MLKSADTVNPIDGESGQSTASATAHDTPSITTSTPNTMLVTAHTYASSRNWTPQAGLTEAFDRLSGAASATGQSIAGSHQAQPLAGASGTKRSTAATSADVGNTHIVALRRFIPNVPPTVSLSSPANGASFTAPASVTITAVASDPDGTIQKVEFFHGGTNLIATLTSAPYSIDWSGVPQGSYALTAVATDNQEATATSAPVNVTVTAVPVLHFIHVDHLNTPRLVANQSGQTVWRWDQQEPFGVNVPDENPSALGAFEFPLRFPGQYADKETMLYYNYFRDYDPTLGSYVEADPIGVVFGWPRTPSEGLNRPYSYVDANPLSAIDRLGLISKNREDRSRDRPEGRGESDPPATGPYPSSPNIAAQLAQFERCWDKCYGRESKYCYLIPVVCVAAGIRAGGASIIPLGVGAIVLGDACFPNTARYCTRICVRQVFGGD